MHRYILYVILTALAAFTAKAAVPSPDALLQQYRTATTQADSLTAMYNFFDVSQYHRRQHAGMRLFELATRMANDSITLSVMRDITAEDQLPDSTLATLISHAERMKPSADRDQTLVLLRVRKAMGQERTLKPDERRRQLQELLTLLNSDSEYNNNVYNRIETLLKITVLLGIETQSDLLTDYYDRLAQEIPLLLPEENRQLIQAFYRRSDEAYTLNGKYDKAVAAGKNLLDVLDEIRSQTRRGNRPYAQFDDDYYVVYRRLLNNFQGLDRAEIAEYYDSLMSIVRRNAESYEDYRTNERAEIYYLMAMKRYGEALNVLKRQVNKPHNAPFRRILLRSMIEASKSIGDREALLESSLAYNQLLEERLRNKSDERARELEIIYNVAELNSENQRLDVERQRSQTRSTGIVMLMLGVLLLVLGTMTVVFMRQYRTTRNLAAELNLSNEMLTGERDNLKHVLEQLTSARDQAKAADRKKTEFVNNILHEIEVPINTLAEYNRLIVDCIDESKRRYMSKYSDLVLLNVELLQTIVSDLQDMAAADHSRISVRLKPMSVNKVCEIAMANVEGRVAPDVKLTFAKATAPDVTIISDQSRISQVLINLLNNAAKFTEKGSIVLDYEVDPFDKLITFTVTDTGIGIPQGKEKVIFGRFTKLNAHTQGLGLGLAICRLMARLLRGRVELDESYRRGARFRFVIPTQPSTQQKNGVKS